MPDDDIKITIDQFGDIRLFERNDDPLPGEGVWLEVETVLAPEGWDKAKGA